MAEDRSVRGNELRPTDVFPSEANDLSLAELRRAVFVQDDKPTGVPNGTKWVDTSETPPMEKIYDKSSSAFVPAGQTGETVSQSSEPSDPTVGLIWFDTTTDVPGMKYYTGTSWATVKQGRNIPDSNGYIYDEGAYESYWDTGTETGSGSLNKLTSSLYAKTAGTTGGDDERSWTADVAVDLTNYSTLEIDWEGYTDNGMFYNAFIHIDESQGTESNSAANLWTKGSAFSRTTETYDISSYSGDYHVSVGVRDETTSESYETVTEAYSMRVIE